ncbi:AfsR/SARP family transcriptional regulator [Amycolatopsis alba]|uniref:AfsR/SARP family transcriptional regulator n=1 Tax=Amycolatopsis alba TaxID=76020 RepID=UPI00039DA2E2|nr:BTAD domain-containing putative transcriptional regulator [Amycolatopsis alba]
MEIEFRLFGGIEAHRDGQRVDLGHARQRAVLAVLLAAANQVVTIDQLVDRVWGESPPNTSRNTLYGYLYRLRRALGGTPDVVITRQSGGYVLSVDPLTVDMHRFAILLHQAGAADDEKASLDLLEQALDACRGNPFPDMDTPWANNLREQLTRQRFDAELDLIDLAVRQGRHADWVSPLADRVIAHPLDERLAGQYMLVLYRAGRQADALKHYQHTRRQLADDLGIDPSPALQRLHQQIMTADPALDTPLSTAPTLTPRQLPPPPWSFTARRGEFAQLSKALDNDAVKITAIVGGGGMGKTWLALQWRTRISPCFPTASCSPTCGGSTRPRNHSYRRWPCGASSTPSAWPRRRSRSTRRLRSGCTEA